MHERHRASGSRPLRILHVASEVAPFSKTGGLGDVASALPMALAELGVETTVISPRYDDVDPAAFGLARRLRTLPIRMGTSSLEVVLHEGTSRGVRWCLVEHAPSFDRDGLYGNAAGDFPDNAVRFGVLCRAALAWADREGGVDLVHAHDWQAALACFDLARRPAPRPQSVLTIHNLAYQGTAPAATIDALGLGWDAFTPEGVEFYGQLSLLKAGIVAADRLTTVSPRYAREIRTPELGCGLDGLLRANAGKLSGILNGIDSLVWDPARDRFTAANYSLEDLSGKRACKRALQAQLGLPVRPEVPLVGVVSRLAEQKGSELLLEAAPKLAPLDLQLGILGDGDAAIGARLTDLAARHPRWIAVRIGYNDALAHAIYAGADLFAMPSRFEPCGLGQLYALRYGTAPVVRATGGLDDTVVDWDARTRTGTGFRFEPYTPEALAGALARAVATYRDPMQFAWLVRSAMRQDFSWRASARRYLSLYRELVPYS
jgi:starch synthase